MNKKRGFTLVELLVVIGIIGLLISILMPALNKARQQAQTIACLSNLRQLGLAAVQYSSTFHGYTVPGYASKTVVSGNGQDSDGENWATVLVNYNFISAPTLPTVTSPISGESSVFRCPAGSDDFLYNEFTDANGTAPTPKGRADALGARPLRTKSLSTGIIVDTWYGINASIDNFTTILSPCIRIPSSGAYIQPKVTQIRDSSKMVFLFDGIFIDIYYDADRVNARHKNQTQTNILFFDGHAETFDTKNLPGGMGPNTSGADVFSAAAIGYSPTLDWRLNQN